jgi:heterodisulfide reductase subunit A
MLAQIDAALDRDADQKILTFACNWCSYAGADLAGVSRLQYPPNARIIHTMCSGRVDPDWVLYGFQKGAAVVLVSGCHFGDCHYIDANHHTAKRVERLKSQLERQGIRPERLHLEWVSAAEGQKWARLMHDLEKLRQTVTRKEVQATVKILGQKRKK